MSVVVQLAEFKARRAAPPVVKTPGAFAHLTAKPGVVLLVLGSRDEFDLSPGNARVWAERLVAMADVAEALEREGDP